MLREEELHCHPPGRGPDATSPHPGAVPPILWAQEHVSTLGATAVSTLSRKNGREALELPWTS